MADIPRKVRSRNSHEPNNLTLGHFGTPKYDDSVEEWSFLRSARQEHNKNDGNSWLEGRPVLQLLHSQLVPAEDAAEPIHHSAHPSCETSTPAHRPLRSQYATRLALSSLPKEDPAKPPHRSTPDRPCIVLGYASSSNELAHHDISVPIVVAAYPGEHVLRVNVLKLAGDVADAKRLPVLDEQQAVVAAPLKKPVLGLCFSADKRYLAIRQRSGTSIVIPFLDGPRSNGIDPVDAVVRFHHIVTLPWTKTGGHPHADVAFHPKNHTLLGIVDEHGNWSAWQLKGKRSTTSHILYTVSLRISGKLLPSAANSKQFGKELYFDGWHKICCLTTGSDETNVLFVCSRRVARTYHSNGRVRGDVDMRLGSPSAKNWVLDVRASLQHSAVCYALTSTRVLVLRLSHDRERRGDLDLLCSWVHFRGKSDMSLRMDVVETASVTGLFLRSERTSTPLAFWLRWTEGGQLASVADPQLLTMPAYLPQRLDEHSEYRFEAIRIGGTLTSRGQSPSTLVVKLLATLGDGRLCDATYSFTDAVVSESDQARTDYIMRIPQLKEWRLKSARVVSDEDEFLDFLVADHDPIPRRAGPDQEPSLSRVDKKLVKTRDWPDLLSLEINADGDIAVEDALGQLGNPQENLAVGELLQTLSELLPEIRILDVEETANTMSMWQTAQQTTTNPAVVSRHTGTSRASITGSFMDTYQSITDSYVRPISTELPERARVQTERLSRQVAFDQYTSSLTQTPLIDDGVSEDLPAMETLQVSSPPPMVSEDAAAVPFAVLHRYTGITKPPTAGLASKTVSSILAHLPSGSLSNPDTYSYEDVEERLKEQRTREELDNLDARARRKAERTAARQEARIVRQQKLREEVTQQSILVPGLVLSDPLQDPRQVQSSQPGPPGVGSSQPGLSMTQPERGAHGERRHVVRKGGKRRKGF